MALTSTSNESADADANAKALDRLNHLKEQIGTETTNFQVLIPDSTSQHFILGPALKSTKRLPDCYNSEFPKRKTEEFLINNQNAKFYERFYEHRGLWLTNDPNWVPWFERVEDQKGYIWHKAGIYDILQFSKFAIPFNRSLVLAALCFWSTSTNSFHLRHGPLTITLLDLSALLGLRPDGPQFDALVANSISIPDDNFGIRITKNSSFSSFIKEHNKIEGLVTDEEHVAFLHYWLCRYLLCSRSFKIVTSNLPLAVALSRGEPYALGPLVLAYLYRGIKDLLDSELGASGGPIWILQLWLHTYFPKVRPSCISVPNLTCEGLKYVFFEGPEFSFHDCLLYLCHLDTEENFNFMPYSKSDALPRWLIFPQSEMTKTGISTILDMWASFLVSRDLPGCITCGKSGKKICGVEAYCPNLCARQFGLIQDIPAPPFFSFNTDFSERTVFQSSEQFQELEATASHLFKKLKFVPFSLLPRATSSFKGWWAKYYEEVFPRDQDLIHLFKLHDLDQNRPLPPLKSNDALKKRKESTLIQTERPGSDRLQAKQAIYEKSTSTPLSKRQQSDIDMQHIAEVTEYNSTPKLEDVPPTEVADASNAKLPSQISSPPSEESAESRPPQVAQFPLQAVSSHPNNISKESGSYRSRFHDNLDVKMSKPLHSARALDFLDTYLHHHPDACLLAITEDAPIPDSYEISQAKAKIQSITTLSLDEVMEIECLRNLKSSLEILLNAYDQTGVEYANIENVQVKLASVKSKYHKANGTVAEVRKKFNQKIALEQEVEVYNRLFSKAQADEEKLQACIIVQKSRVEELEKKLIEEKANLEKLEELNSNHKTEMDEFRCKLEHSQKLLLDHCMQDKTWVKKAMQAKNNFKSMEATWVQIQQLLSLISVQKTGEANP
ncbi:hypothetical protein D8674_006107 [Pyrus ussuriensis x Pyrus communis]|uniref:Aminotransferase-like plant mobile domain-containing protein n=1 Tax=Pyrus ussuriensis x Pyrus communis TaxID=2448454 RepID=A0A5N5FYB2_9ROSA|nr:hypothetical protein D8674_006107 [Pyrus ussuriensis x Pyrus communis]